MLLVIPDEIANVAKLSQQDLLQELALILYQQNRLTLGQASRLADLYQGDFLDLLASRDISIHYDVDDFEQDLRTLQDLGRLAVVRSNTSEEIQPAPRLT